jgi:formate dehydrogenase subunit gamma
MADIRAWLLCFAALLGILLVTAGANAQTGGPVGPAVTEQQLLQELQKVQGRISIPDQRAATLIQPAGRDWQAFHTGTLPWIGGIAILGMLAVLVVFYLVKGRIRIEAGHSDRTVIRFNGFERFVHWITAGSFIVLGLTGLNISFGRIVLLPLIGPEAFTAVSQWGKYTHNFVAVAFAVGIVLMILIWLKDNFPDRTDARWLAEGGGLLGSGHPPARRFNAGQKLIFWSVVLSGIGLTVTGVILLFPFRWTDMAGMQLATVVHAVLGIVMVGVILAHIYIGSIGMEGAFAAMGSGEVDRNWALQHHELWVAEEERRSRAEVRPGGRVLPAE